MNRTVAEPATGPHLVLFMKSLVGGGAERVMINLAAGFASRGCRVDLLVCDSSGPLAELVPPEVRLIDLGGRRLLYSLPPLIRYLRRHRPTALLATLVHANIIAVWARALAGVRPRLVLRAATVLRLHLGGFSTAERVVLPWLVRGSYRRADHVVAVAKDVADDLIEGFGVPAERVRIIANPIVSRELVARGREPLDDPWFLPGEPPVLLGVGRLTPLKRFDLLLSAFAMIRRDLPARLIILGEGEERPALERRARDLGLATDEVAFRGFVRNPQAYMSRARLLVLPSDYDALPGVLIEALALGCPVVATDSPGGTREILQGGAIGPLVPPGNAEALADAIRRALAAEPDREQLRARADHYSADGNIERYLELLCPGAAGSGRSPPSQRLVTGR